MLKMIENSECNIKGISKKPHSNERIVFLLHGRGTKFMQATLPKLFARNVQIEHIACSPNWGCLKSNGQPLFTEGVRG